MKTLAAFALAVLLALLSPAAHAQVQQIHNAVISGTLTTSTPGVGKGLTIVPLTKKALLNLFGVTNVSPAQAYLFTSPGENNSIQYYLASKDAATVYGVIASYNANDLTPLVTDDGTQFVGFGDATGVNGGYAGSVGIRNHVHFMGTTYSAKNQLTFTGVAHVGQGAGNNSIFQITIQGTGTGKLPPAAIAAP